MNSLYRSKVKYQNAVTPRICAHVKDLAWRAVWEHADGRQDLVK